MRTIAAATFTFTVMTSAEAVYYGIREQEIVAYSIVIYAIIGSARIEADVLGLRYCVTDFLSGLPERTDTLPLGANAGTEGCLCYPGDRQVGQFI